MRPSARKAETKSAVHRHVQLDDARRAPALVITTSFSTSAGHVRLAARGARPRAAAGAPRTRSAPASTPSSVGVELGERDLGQEAEAAEVHAQRRASRALEQAAGREQRAVAAQHHERVGLRRPRRAPRRTAQSPPASPSASAAVRSSSRRATPRASQPARRGRAAPARPRARSGRARMPIVVHGPTAASQPAPRARRARQRRAARRRRCRKNSRLPSAPVIGDAQAPRTRVAQRACAARGHVARAPARCSAGSRHDAAAAHLAPADLELRLHQHDRVRVRARARRAARAGSCAPR